jgi:hypothetical protein
MSPQKPTLRIGFWAAALNIVGGIAYLVILAIIITASIPMSDPGALPLITVSTLLLIGPVGLVPLWAAIHLTTSEEKKVFSLISLGFMLLFVATTSINRWVHLTVVRQSLAANVTKGLEWFTPYGQHSIMFAIEQLAYGWFLGFALVFLAPVFGGRSLRLERGLFWAFLISGILCLTGALGTLMASNALLMVGMLGWAVGLGLINVLLAVWFRRLERNASS